MQEGVESRDVVKEVHGFLAERKESFLRAGGDAARLLVDPGIGFGKELDHNIALIKAVPDLREIAPVVLGLSRKSFLGRFLSDSRDGVPGA
jgi:dihydropteroate synthase